MEFFFKLFKILLLIILPGRCVVRGMFHASANTSTTVPQYYPHMSVPSEMSIGRVSFLIKPIFLVLRHA